MPKLDRSVAALRFFGDDLDPDEITLLLGAAPTLGARKGGVWLTPGGREKVAKSGTWVLEAKDHSPGDLDGQVEELLSSLTIDMSVWNDLKRRFSGDIFLGLFLAQSNEGITLSPETLYAVGSRGLILDAAIYAPPLED
jgi:hypothetical protein